MKHNKATSDYSRFLTAEVLTNRCNKNQLRARAIAKLLEKYAGKPMQGLNILEYGCNTGYALREFALMGNVCHGVDVSEELIAVAEDKNSAIQNLHFTRIDDILPFPDNYFDVVFSSEVLEHVPISGRSGYLKEFRRVMKDDGIGYISYPNFWFPLEQHYFIPFHHWVNRLFPYKNIGYEDIPSKFEARSEIGTYFLWNDITTEFLNSEYVSNYYGTFQKLLARSISTTFFSIQDCLILRPITRG